MHETPVLGRVRSTMLWRYQNLSLSWRTAWARDSELDSLSKLELLEVYLKLSDRNRAWFAFWLITWSQTGTAVTTLTLVSWCNTPAPSGQGPCLWDAPLDRSQAAVNHKGAVRSGFDFPCLVSGKASAPAQQAMETHSWERSLLVCAMGSLTGTGGCCQHCPNAQRAATQRVGRASEQCWAHSL